LAKGLVVKRISVKTDRPISKDKIFDAMKKIKEIVVEKDVKVGDIVKKNFINPDVNLVATREVKKLKEGISHEIKKKKL